MARLVLSRFSLWFVRSAPSRSKPVFAAFSRSPGLLRAVAWSLTPELSYPASLPVPAPDFRGLLFGVRYPAPGSARKTPLIAPCILAAYPALYSKPRLRPLNSRNRRSLVLLEVASLRSPLQGLGAHAKRFPPRLSADRSPRSNSSLAPGGSLANRRFRGRRRKEPPCLASRCSSGLAWCWFACFVARASHACSLNSCFGIRIFSGHN